MKINQFHRTFPQLVLSAAILALAAGCATHDEHSYNQDYNQNLPTSPKYTIENVDDNQFKVIVHQGSPYEGSQRVIYVKQVASTVAESEAKRRGWQNWDLNYIQERDQGWMHIVIADVTRKNAIEKTPDSTR
jgi:type IV pilus biogenesis protein CpaD/CtpE